MVPRHRGGGGGPKSLLSCLEFPHPRLLTTSILTIPLKKQSIQTQKSWHQKQLCTPSALHQDKTILASVVFSLYSVTNFIVHDPALAG